MGFPTAANCMVSPFVGATSGIHHGPARPGPPSQSAVSRESRPGGEASGPLPVMMLPAEPHHRCRYRLSGDGRLMGQLLLLTAGLQGGRPVQIVLADGDAAEH